GAAPRAPPAPGSRPPPGRPAAEGASPPPPPPSPASGRCPPELLRAEVGCFCSKAGQQTSVDPVTGKCCGSACRRCPCERHFNFFFFFFLRYEY
uniref:Uncharacterized protein n=1 Tax=Calidris pygmaea TaxID=425635 RepID=A0A8C3JBP8_9CHAR